MGGAGKSPRARVGERGRSVVRKHDASPFRTDFSKKHIKGTKTAIIYLTDRAQYGTVIAKENGDENLRTFKPDLS
jgi:hypothetical protein